MSYEIFDPHTVLSPKRKVKNVRVILNTGAKEGGYSIAKVEWNGSDVFAIRWNISEDELSHPDKETGTIKCIGQPNSHGFPTWFILPNEFLCSLMDNNSELYTSLKPELL